MTGWPLIEYTDISELRGPLAFIRGVSTAGYDDVASITLDSGPRRHGVVLEMHGDLAVVQVLEGTTGMGQTGGRVAFHGAPMRIPVGPAWLGRTCNGRGEPVDGGPPILAGRTAPVAGIPMNPTWREPPSEPVFTGVSVIDALTTLVRGQKLPVFAVAGGPYLRLATQIAAQANVGGEPFCVVFAGMGLTHADAAFVRDALDERAAAGELVLLVNTADEPVVERILTPRVALTVAEDLAYVGGRHVLVVMTDMTGYAEALREVSAARGEIPARRAYPGYLYSDLASLYERCGRMRGCCRLGHRGAGAHHAGRGHHAPRPRSHRLHHRGPDRPVRRGPGSGAVPAGRAAVVAVPAHAQRRRRRPSRHCRAAPGRARAGPAGRRAGRADRPGRAEPDGPQVPRVRPRVRSRTARSAPRRGTEHWRTRWSAPGERCSCCPVGNWSCSRPNCSPRAGDEPCPRFPLDGPEFCGWAGA